FTAGALKKSRKATSPIAARAIVVQSRGPRIRRVLSAAELEHIGDRAGESVLAVIAERNWVYTEFPAVDSSGQVGNLPERMIHDVVEFKDHTWRRRDIHTERCAEFVEVEVGQSPVTPYGLDPRHGHDVGAFIESLMILEHTVEEFVSGLD